MHNRIKEVRKDAKLSQEDFAKRLGFESRGAISNIEAGKEAKPGVIKRICKEFGVREEWILEGTGPKYEDNQEAARITSWAADTLADGDPFKLRLLGVMSRLTPEQWDGIKALAEHLVNGGE